MSEELRPAMSISDADAVLTAPGSLFETDEILVRGRPTRVWKNAISNFAEVVEVLRGYEYREFAVYGDERIGYAGLLRATETFANFLVEQGITKGDRVALAMRNLPEWPVAFLATTAIGAIIVPLNAWWTSRELIGAIADSGSVMLIADADRIDRIASFKDELPALRHVIGTRGARDGVRSLESIIGDTASWHLLPTRPMPAVAIDADEHATIFYTSGTTSSPKGVLGSHRAALTTPLTHAYGFARSLVRSGQTPPPDQAQKVMLCGVPFFHVSGCHSALLTSLLAGARLVIIYRWDAGEVLRLIEKERVTMTGGVPTIAWQLLEHADRARYDLSSLEVVGYGGAPAPAELQRQLSRQLAVHPSTGWGMTETSATFMSHIGVEYAGHPESCGVPSPVSRQRIVDPESGTIMAPGEIGELQVYGPMVVEGYWNKPEATAEVFQDGWLRTGDLARVDEEGFFYIVGRAKDLILRGGENIYPAEVEAVLFEHPAVDDAAVLGIAHPRLGEQPVAVVHFAPSHQPDEKELQAWVAARLAAFKVPVRIVALPDLLPRNANGKILKQELVRWFA